MNPIDSVTARRTPTPPPDPEIPPEPAKAPVLEPRCREPGLFDRFGDFGDGVGNARDRGTQAFEHGVDAAGDLAADTAELVGEGLRDVRDTAQGLVGPAIGRGGDRVSAARAHANVESSVRALDSDGDRFYLRVTGEAKAKLLGGVKGQYGGDMDVTRNGDGADATYVVGIDKEVLGALAIEAPFGIVKIKGEAGLASADRVEMEFDSADDAVRAARLLRRVAVADAAGDALRASPPIGGLPFLGSPLAGGANPLGNPLGRSGGAPSALLQRAVGVDADDRAFLADSVSAYETKLTYRERGALELKIPALFAAAGAEARLDDGVSVTRRVELPEDAAPGRLSCTVAREVRGSAKQKLEIGLALGPLANGTLGLQNRLELGRASLEATAAWEIPATGGDAFAGPPELDLAAAGPRAPDSLSAALRSELRTQLDPLDLGRGDSRRFEAGFEVRAPEKLAAALPRLLRGDVEGAATAADAAVTTTDERVERSGYAVQPGFKGEVLFVAGVDASVILEAGIDDVRRTEVPPADAPTPSPDAAPAPEHKVVVPRDGLNVRTEPDGDVVSVLRHGAFVTQAPGAPEPAGEGEWVRIGGTDVAGRAVEGWVDVSHLAGHDEARGAMGSTGRIDPALEDEGYVAITVAEDDNLWNVARTLGVDPVGFVALNEAHVIDPTLVFAGDTVYAAKPEASAP